MSQALYQRVVLVCLEGWSVLGYHLVEALDTTVTHGLLYRRGEVCVKREEMGVEIRDEKRKG